MELKRPRRRAGNSFFMSNCSSILKRANLPAADEVTSPITSQKGRARTVTTAYQLVARAVWARS